MRSKCKMVEKPRLITYLHPKIETYYLGLALTGEKIKPENLHSIFKNSSEKFGAEIVSELRILKVENKN